MSNIATLQSLLSRVEAATGPDRKIDLDVARALVPDLVDPPITINLYLTGREVRAPEFILWRYTASVDACIALADRVLPGWWWSIERFGGAHPRRGFFMARMFTAVMPEEREIKELASANTASLAMLACILRAKIALAEQEPT
jgi:hypothetical protein